MSSFTPSRWPFDETRAARLCAFQSSELHAAQVEVSDFWNAFGSRTGVDAGDDLAVVRAGFAFGALGERAPAALPVPAIWLWRLRLKALAERRERADEGRLAEREYEPGVVGRDLAELPAYRELKATRPSAPMAIFRYASYLNALVPETPRGARILEIGGGTGLLAYGAAELLDSPAAVLVDLPQMLEVAFVVLTGLGAEVALPHEPDRRAQARFTLLTPGQAGEVEDGGHQLILNTASFGEMPAPVTAAYFDLIERAAAPGARFFCANEERSSRVGPEADFDRYPWRATWRTLLDRRDPFAERVGGLPSRERLVEIGH